MISKKMNILKFAMPIGLSLIVLFISAKGVLKSLDKIPGENPSIVNNSVIIPIQSNPTLRDSIVEFGMEFLGTPYVSGGCSKDGFDCSGYVYFVYKHFKIQVPRSSAQFKNFGKEIPIENVQKGDILLFLSPTRNVIGHVGIVSNPKGIESDFIHSTSGRDMKVIISSLKTSGYARRFVKAVNVL
jgi:cell wall-associated NlpC family hydrolase